MPKGTTFRLLLKPVQPPHLPPSPQVACGGLSACSQPEGPHGSLCCSPEPPQELSTGPGTSGPDMRSRTQREGSSSGHWGWREPHQAQLCDGVDVVLVFLHLFPEADRLLQLQGVHILGPAPLDVVDTSGLHLDSLCVGLNREPWLSTPAPGASI